MELFGNEGDTFGGKLNDSCGVKPGSGAGGSDKGGCTLNKIGAGSNALGAEGDTPGVMSDNSCGMVEPGSEVPDGRVGRGRRQKVLAQGFRIVIGPLVKVGYKSCS